MEPKLKLNKQVRWVTTGEVVALTGLSRTAVKNAIARGAFTVQNIAGQELILRSDVDALLQQVQDAEQIIAKPRDENGDVNGNSAEGGSNERA